MTASRDELVVRSGLLAGGPRSVQLPVGDIAQLYVVERVSKWDEDAREAYLVYARDRRGRDHELVKVGTPEEAWWIEERLERHLGLVDERVSPDEHRRPMLLPPPVSK